MARKKNKNLKNALLFGGVIFILLVAAGYININQLVSNVLSPFTTPIDTDTDIVPGTDMVKFSVFVRESAIDASNTAADIIVNAYADNDGEVGGFLGTATASSGLATFTIIIQEGSYIWLQGRQAAPASMTHYQTPAERFRVGNGGDAVPTVAAVSTKTGLNILYVDEVCDTAPTFTAMNSTFYEVNTTALHEVCTAETILYFRITMSSSDTDERYGGNDFVDYGSVNHDRYLGGVWLVLKTNATCAFEGYYATFSDLTYQYYVFRVCDYLYQTTGSSTDNPSITYSVSLISGADWSADTQIVADIYDTMLLVGGGITSSTCFVDAHSISPTAETFDVNN